MRSVVDVVCLAAALCLWAFAPLVGAAEPAGHPGADVYRRHCAACHDQPADGRTPPRGTLEQMSARALHASLTTGVMQQQAAGLAQHEVYQLVDFLAAQAADGGEWLAGMRCEGAAPEVAMNGPVSLAMVGVDHRSSRHLTAGQAGLDSGQLARLELAWAIAFPDTTALRSSPVIVGETLFYAPVETGRLLALDVTRPCVRWVYDAGTQLRTSVSYGTLGAGGRQALLFADRLGRVHTVDPRTGEPIWVVDGRHSEAAAITGSPVLHGERIIVPVSASGVGRGADPDYECCVEHGAVVALDARTGAKLWIYHTMPDADYNGRVSRVGVRQRGPSGAPIWSTPTVDAGRGLVYATTGQNTSLPATSTSDAVLAIDLASGELRWSFQALVNDVWIIGCRDTPEASVPNCPSPRDSVLKDFDFGAAAVLVTVDGRDVLLAGQKSGDVWALDPDTGKVLWNRRFGEGTPLGGIHWGLATDGERVFAAINDPRLLRSGRPGVPGMNALDVRTGEVLWQRAVQPDCPPGRQARYERCNDRYGLSAAPLVVDRSIIAGGVDGRLYVYDAATGEQTFEFDTLRDFETINGVAGHGGSIDSHSIFAGAGMVFVASGYGSFGQAPGNVLLAFRPRTGD